MDSVLSALALVVLAPFFGVIAILIKLDSPGPVFYRHDRLARAGRPFALLKFRTMGIDYCRGKDYGGEKAEIAFRQIMDDPERREQLAATYKLAKDPRVTRFGDFLRRTSLDELPQLLNVFLGDISLVGPRPITKEELTRYGTMAKYFLDIHPGVTGYWQIN